MYKFNLYVFLLMKLRNDILLKFVALFGEALDFCDGVVTFSG